MYLGDVRLEPFVAFKSFTSCDNFVKALVSLLVSPRYQDMASSSSQGNMDVVTISIDPSNEYSRLHDLMEHSPG